MAEEVKEVEKMKEEKFKRPMVVLIPKREDEKVGEDIDTLLGGLNGFVLVITRSNIPKIGAFGKRMQSKGKQWWFVGFSDKSHKPIVEKLKQVIHDILKHGFKHTAQPKPRKQTRKK